MRHSLTPTCLQVILSLTFWLLWSPSLSQALSNRTIDDSNGDPVTGAQISYTPEVLWNYGPTCGSCSAKLDASQAFDQTWHDGSYYPGQSDAVNAQVSFTGTAVYVYGIKGFGTSFSTTDLTFLIDNQQVGQYSQPATTDNTGAGDWEYNSLFFSKDSLSSGQHTLTIINGANKGSSISLLLLDYIVYSFEEAVNTSAQADASVPSPSPKSESSQTTSSSITLTSSSAHTTTSANTTITSANATSTSSTSSNATKTAGVSSGTDATVDQTATVTAISSSVTSGVSLPSALSSGHFNTAVIIGSVAGAVLVILLAMTLLAWWLRRRAKENRFRLMPNNGPDVPLSNTEASATAAAPRTEVLPRHLPSLLRRPHPPTITPFPVGVADTTDGHIITDESLRQATPPVTEKEVPSSILSSKAQTIMVDTATTLADEVRRLREENDQLRVGVLISAPQAETDEVLPPPYSQPSPR